MIFLFCFFFFNFIVSIFLKFLRLSKRFIYLRLIINKNIETIKWSNLEIKQICQFYNECFRTISIEIYSSKNEQLDIDTYVSTNKSLTEPLCIELDYYYNLFEKMYGAKLYFPIEDKLLLIKGYFKKDYFKYSTLTYNFARDKFNNIKYHLGKISNISNTFKQNYIQIIEFLLVLNRGLTTVKVNILQS